MTETVHASESQLERPTLQVDLVRLEKLLWAVVAVSIAADIATTFYGLHIGLIESNPVAIGAIESHGVAGMIGLKTSAVAVALGCRRILDAQYRPIVPLGLAAPWVVASILNTYLIVVIAP